MTVVGFIRERRVMGALWRAFVLRDEAHMPCVGFTCRLAKSVKPRPAIVMLFEDFEAIASGGRPPEASGCPDVARELAPIFAEDVRAVVQTVWGGLEAASRGEGAAIGALVGAGG